MIGPIFDTHAHYSARAFDPDRFALLDSLPSQGVVGVCEHAPAAAAAMVANGGDQDAGKADCTAQRFCRGHAVCLAINKMRQDHTQKALGAVQDAAKGASKHGNCNVIKGVLGRGLPQTQGAAFQCELFALGQSRDTPLQDQAGEKDQHTAKHEPHTCKAEDGGGVAGLDLKQAVSQFDKGKGGPPQCVAQDGQQHRQDRRTKDTVQPRSAG